jgi:alcohol dehydrogenase class IV
MLTDTLANGIAGKNAMGISHLLQTQLGPKTPTPHS